jgi:phosphate transport system substrate-binding protein
MKKRMLLIAMAVLVAVSVVATGCPPPVETLKVGGSTTVYVVTAPLAERFMERYPDITVEMFSVGSTPGIVGTNDGTYDIGMSSRWLREAELAWNFTQVVAYHDALAPIVHPTNPVTDLSMEQLKGIFLGNITNWAEVGGPDLRITVIIREAGSGARGAWEDHVHEDIDPTLEAIVLPGTLGVRAGVAGNPAAISYVTPAALDASVKALTVEGVAATTANVKAGTYEITRPGLFLTKGAPSPLERTFLDWLLGPEGQRLLEEAGMVRVR